MPDTNDGNSKAEFTAEFNKDGSQVNATGDTIGATTAESHTTEAKAEEKTNSQPDDVSKKDNTGKTEKALHYQALDLIGTVLDEDYKGDRKEFFTKHPELAAIADKSKRYKDDYRKLNASEGVNTKNADDDDVIDEETLAERVYAKVTDKTLTVERKSLTEKYAEREGINKDDFETFHKAAESMHKSTGLDFAKCLDGAKAALKGTSSKEPMKIPSGSGMVKDGVSKEVEVEKMIKEHGVDKKTAEKYLSSKTKAYNGELNTWTAVM